MKAAFETEMKLWLLNGKNYISVQMKFQTNYAQQLLNVPLDSEGQAKNAFIRDIR